MSDKSVLFLTSFFVAFWAIGNLIRLLWDISICLGPFTFPGWTGAIGYVVLGLLAAYSFRALSALSDQPPNHIT